MQNKYNLVNVVWEFTLDCNLNCIHCGSSAGRKRGDELTTSEAEKLCHDLKKTGCLGITLMGGEPLLRKDFWHIAALIGNLDMELTVITNGTVYDQETFSKLRSLNPRTVAVSLDASKPELHDQIRNRKGAFDKTCDFMNIALKEGLPVSVITTVHKMNLMELPAIRDLLLGRNVAWQIQIAGSEGRRFPKELLLDEEDFYSVGMFIASTRKKYPVKQMPVIGADDLGFNSMMLNNISLAPEWTGCHAGISVLGIQSNGNIKGCLSMTDIAIEGNVRSMSVYDIWNSDTAFSYSRAFDVSDTGENCRNCIHLKKCKGGCNEMSLMKTGRLHNDPYCFYAIEKKLFSEELKDPLTRIRLGLKRRLNAITAKHRQKRLSDMFMGYRGQ
ncbi:MAG: radical SAM/SPASM domain-containing protein [Syntrophus sp. (in: bacteria)]|nr:radical SAM/SPASM domain-containing protein [Syntrophus sp. (in: bacteria)]